MWNLIEEKINRPAWPFLIPSTTDNEKGWNFPGKIAGRISQEQGIAPSSERAIRTTRILHLSEGRAGVAFGFNSGKLLPNSKRQSTNKIHSRKGVSI